MTDRRLRYSERKALAETGSLGDLQADVPSELRNAISIYVHYARQAADSQVRKAFDTALADALGRHFGEWELIKALSRPAAADFLDAMEILVDEGAVPRRYTYYQGGSSSVSTARCLPKAEVDLNQMFDRHRFAYRFEEGAIRPVMSPLLDAEIVGPALLAISRPGWENVERSYREALLHQRRSDEWHESLTAAAAAVEAALKAAGYSGATLGALTRDFRRAPIASGYSPQIVDHLAELIEQLMAWRSHSGSAHGKEPGSTDPPPELVALAIHWAGSFIVYLGSVH